VLLRFLRRITAKTIPHISIIPPTERPMIKPIEEPPFESFPLGASVESDGPDPAEEDEDDPDDGTIEDDPDDGTTEEEDDDDIDGVGVGSIVFSTSIPANESPSNPIGTLIVKLGHDANVLS